MLLKDDRMRTFQIDIEDDTLVEADERAEQSSRVEFLSAIAPFMEKAMAAGQQVPDLVPVIGEMLLFGIRGFKVGQSMESTFENAFDQMAEKQKQAEAQPKQPDPVGEAEMQDAELQRWKTEQDNQTKIMLAKMNNDKDIKLAAMASRKPTNGDTELDDFGNEAPNQVLQQFFMAQQEANAKLAQMLVEGIQALGESMAMQLSRPKKLARLPDGTKVAVPVDLPQPMQAQPMMPQPINQRPNGIN